MPGDSCGATGRRSLRLYYEACIPALLLVLLAWRYGVPPSSGGVANAAVVVEAGADQSSAVLYMGACLLSLVSLIHRLDWRSSGEDDTHTTAEYRPSADDGAVYGSLLVPVSVLAASIGAAATRPSLDSGARCLHPSLILSLGMSVTFTAHYHWLRIWHSTRGEWLRTKLTCLILGLWLAATIALGCAELVKSLPRSFTMGEAAVLAQGFALVTMDIGLQLTHRVSSGEKRVPDQAYWESRMHVLCLEAAVLSLYLAVSALARIAATNTLEKRARRGMPGLLLLGAVFGGFGALALALVSYISQLNPVRWILGTALGSRAHIAVLAYWIALLAVAGIVYALAMAKGSSVSGSSAKFVLHVKRKSYHILAVLTFVPGLVYARPLLHMGFAVALAGFVAAECMRALDIGPCSKPIDAFMRRFIDYRDAGPIVTAHFYLLLGCAVPVWLGGHSSVAGLAGVLSLGVADTAASMVGMKLGRVRWPGTAKTVEGTAGFCLSLLLAIGAVLRLEGADVSAGRWACYAAACLVLGVLEALTEQNDNLVVPLCMYALMQALTPNESAVGLAGWLAYAALAAMALLALPRLALASVPKQH
ncbi:dolichol kinase [Coemansia sp. RSA 1694]|nr:dolichol kinase [Coemansia sp. RSA 1694]